LFYIYEHIRPDTNAIFYVGKGNKNRHESLSDRNSQWKSIVAEAGGFKSRIIVKNIDEELSLLAERERIDQLKRLGVKLCNLTSGGQGISGLKHTDESKRKMSESRKNLIPHQHTEESKEKIRKATTGVVFTEERKRKISESRKGAKMPLHVIEKIRLKNKGFRHTAETIKRMCEIQKAMPKSKCLHCSFVGNAGNLARWHFDRCKFKGE